MTSSSSNSSNNNNDNNYPEPLIIPPLRSHKQTFIFLHGRGSNASKFGPELLSTEIPDPHSNDAGKTVTLATAFPHARFVFPTASRSRATVYNRSIITQWFDNWAHTPQEAETARQREDLQIGGLRETSAYLHGLLRREIALLGEGGERNVVLGGLSQGCAASLIALLLWDGKPLAAAVGMCGWLPFRRQMEEIARGVEAVEVEDEEFNPFEADSGALGGDDEGLDLPARAVEYLREELEVDGSASSPSSSSPSLRRPFPFRRIPMLLGHGVEDERVPVYLGREAASCLTAMGVDVSWKEYEGLGHWYSGNMLRDLLDFARQRTGWE